MEGVSDLQPERNGVGSGGCTDSERPAATPLGPPSPNAGLHLLSRRFECQPGEDGADERTQAGEDSLARALRPERTAWTPRAGRRRYSRKRTRRHWRRCGPNWIGAALPEGHERINSRPWGERAFCSIVTAPSSSITATSVRSTALSSSKGRPRASRLLTARACPWR